jgi:hypothetical protein
LRQDGALRPWAGEATLVEGSSSLNCSTTRASRHADDEPTRRLMVTNQIPGMALRGASRPFIAVPLVHLERLFMPQSCRSQRRPRVAELGGRLGPVVVSHISYIPSRWLILHRLKMAEVANVAADVGRHPLADRPAAGITFPGRSGAGGQISRRGEKRCASLGGSTA